MTVGRTPRSNAHKNAVGSRRKPMGEDVAPPTLETPPEPPEKLQGRAYATEEWIRVCKLFVDEDVLTEWELPTIELYCLEWQRYMDACDLIDRPQDEGGGEYMETSTGYMQVTPAHTIRNKAFQHLEKLLQRIGADPASRARMKRVKAAAVKKNRFDGV